MLLIAHDTRVHTMRHPVLLLAAFLFVATAGTASASTGGVGPVFGSYWDQFVEHWLGGLKKQNGVVVAALCVGLLSLFIITRGKWRK